MKEVNIQGVAKKIVPKTTVLGTIWYRLVNMGYSQHFGKNHDKQIRQEISGFFPC
ncbi:hypothetical protein [Bacillus pseudomycoides]|uniref:hypothetical protein n=1 Tax=Bacillus pseudomycoides TaxID=64104 RepID=UPI0003A0C7AC|nr:hypothetical protein [Bacillus pseudomycoides]